jgi:high-affinity iron transporter
VRFRRIVFIISASLFFIVSCATAADNRWNSVVNEIEAALSRGSDAYAEGRAEDARASISDAYFNLFEGKGMEAAIGSHISSARVSELESMFGAIRGAIKANAPASDIKERINLLVKALREDVEKLPKKGGARRDRKESPYTLFFNSFIIIVREGFEAILIISALTAYLVKTGKADKIGTVYRGAGIAIIVSIVTAVLLQTVINISGAGREALEGITMLLATAVLFYVSYWLITKIEVTRWQHYIKSKIESSLSRGNITLLGFAAFLAVYREGAETILFYQALYASSDGNASAMVAGFVSGSLILVGIFALIKYGSVRVPIGPFFAVTSTLLYYLAFTFAGKGILELQEAEWVSSTPVEWIPTIGLLGIYPTWEGVLLQGVLMVLLMVAVVYTFLLRPFREKAMMTKDISHIEADIKALHETLDDVSQHAMICHGLVSGIAGQETEEIGKHLIDIDKKVHEVMDHLAKLEKGFEDIFSELERDIQKG